MSILGQRNLDPETDIMNKFLDPEADMICQLLDPETDMRYQFLFLSHTRWLYGREELYQNKIGWCD